MSEVERIEAKVNSKKKEWLTKKKKLKKTLRLEKPYVKI